MDKFFEFCKYIAENFKNKRWIIRTTGILSGILIILKIFIKDSTEDITYGFVFLMFTYFFCSAFLEIIAVFEDKRTKRGLLIDKVIVGGELLIMLIYAANFVFDVAFLIFKDEFIGYYFATTSFFCMGYIAEILLKKETIGNMAMFINMAVYIQVLCNVLRIGLLVAAAMSKKYEALIILQNIPLTESIVTSLAVEKLIKMFYKDLGKRV